MSWLEKYASFSGAHCEAPRSFHVWAGYSTLAAALGSKVSFAAGPRTLRTNLYLLLGLRAGEGDRDAVLAISRAVAPQAGVVELARCTRTNDLCRQMLQTPQLTLYLSHTGWQRMNGSSQAPILAEWHEVPDSWGYLADGKCHEIERPCLNALAVMDARRLTKLVYRGGMVDHFLVVEGTQRERPLPAPPVPDPDTEAALVSHLRAVVARAPETVTLEALRGEYGRWAEGFEKKARTTLRLVQTQRLKAACLKVAVLERLAEDPTAPPGPEDLRKAIAAIEPLAETLDTLDGEDHDTLRKDLRDAGRLIRALDRAGGRQTLGALRNDLNLTRRQFANALEVLHNTRKAAVRDVAAYKETGRPVAELVLLGPDGYTFIDQRPPEEPSAQKEGAA